MSAGHLAAAATAVGLYWELQIPQTDTFYRGVVSVTYDDAKPPSTMEVV